MAVSASARLVDRRPARRHRVEGEPAAPRSRRVDAARPALEGADAGEQLAEVERLDEVVVGAGVEAADPVGRRVAGGEHQDRRRPLVATRPVDDLDALRAGHPPVEDRDVVLVELQLVDRVVAALDGVDVVAAVGQAERR